jgi:hypothetical protein
MKYLVAAPVVLFMVWLVVGALTGRVKARSCCSIPADRDLRLRDAGITAPASPRALAAAPTTGGVVPTSSAGTTPPQT